MGKVITYHRREVTAMMYPFVTLDDDTEITHSQMLSDGTVRVYVETPDEDGGFSSATCYLPEHMWKDIRGYSAEKIKFLKRLIRDNAHLIMEFSKEGGFQNASNL